ncbi:MAG: efflux RND transporter periplasmic adaptor subunit [Planctomycetota bacterium]
MKVQSVLPAFGLLLGATLGCSEPQFQAPPPPPVVVAEASQEDVLVYEVVSGRTEPFETVEVRARVEGVLQEIAHSDGYRVEAGDLMFRIDPEPFVASRDAAAAQVKAAEAEAELADITATKLEEAFEERAVSELQALEARARHKVALENVEVAEKSLAIRELDVSYTTIHAPISGLVEFSDYFVGSLVGSLGSQALTRVVDDSRLRVWFNLPDRVATYILDDQAKVKEIEENLDRTTVDIGRDIDEDFPFSATVDYADPEIDIETGSLRIRAMLENTERRLSGGQYVRVRLKVGALEGATVVPMIAINRDQQGKYVYIVADGDVVERREVVTGPDTPSGGVVIQSGVSVGERVVVAGQLSARPGSKVVPKAAEDKAPAPAAKDTRSAD